MGPWSSDGGQRGTRRGFKAFPEKLAPMYFVVLAVGLFFAWRNVRLRRGDRRGAFRLSAFVFAAATLSWFLVTEHTGNAMAEWRLLIAGLGRALWYAALLWILYIAVEPLVRRSWPESLISWSRLLAGRFRDPRIGRDVLVGMGFTWIMGLVWDLGRHTLEWTGERPTGPFSWANLDYLLGSRYFFAGCLSAVISAIFIGLFCLVLLFLLRLVLRQSWLALTALFLLWTVVTVVSLGSGYYVETFTIGIGVAMFLTLLTRFGILAAMIPMFFVNLEAPGTLDFSAWYGESAVLALMVLTGITLYGFYVSVGGRPLFGQDLLEN
jgi:hypothetical protein